MLHLASETGPEWTERALADLGEVLLDHAHAEKKAASLALRLMFRYPEQVRLLRPLSELAREELEHFEQVLGQLEARGIPFRRQKPSPYAGRLQSVIRSWEPARLVDTLLCCALVEARSCERFALLAEAAPDAGLAGFYRSLLACEARHHGLYVDLARAVAAADAADPRIDVEARLEEIAQHEADVIAEAPAWPRMHT